ncbi:hypothetical protein [Magnetospirillum sp. UT-4]|uniref:hypothetical protein n=1 Tax=Magnetospirillum sp. UT-4 TaxID=2681467 RepID=UPI00137D975E|nr:hypothetical protein [Magnetospirillum sp. UT-4]CAA7619586.1 conserved hypothetical protein [Magnetospirillum sp. UT-4]
MTTPSASAAGTLHGTTERVALLRIAVAASVFAGSGAAATMAVGGELATVLMVSGLSAAGVAIGYLLGRRDGLTPRAVRLLLFRVSDELAQYRAFTRLLRDQGERITASTSAAAIGIVNGLTEMDSDLARLRTAIDRAAPGNATELKALADAVGSPIVSLLGQLQFQDLTQQQIDFLARLSLIVDQHMIDLAQRLGDRRSMDRTENFKEMFNKALDDCVMTSQRDDHHAAAGLDVHETSGPKVELF